MQTFRKIDRKRLPEVVAAEIETAILDGTFTVGSHLPSEQQLATQFGVSRNVVREAFKFLKERGLINILNGSGTYVCHPSREPTSTALGRYIRQTGAYSNIPALYETRRILEGESVRFAAQRADENDLEVLHACLERMKSHTKSMEHWSEADLDFHLEIARATHNPFLGLLLEPLVDQLRGVIAEGFLVPGAVEKGLEAHFRLYSCICDRDAEGAYETMIEHLRDSESRVTEFKGPGHYSAENV
jgi:GntR family transcriptional repressor for pyruvate dehydrogenase complex